MLYLHIHVMLADPAIQSRLPLGRNKQISKYLISIHDMITRDHECPSHDYCIICSHDVTGTDFENSLYAVGQSQKDRKEVASSMYNKNE